MPHPDMNLTVASLYSRSDNLVMTTPRGWEYCHYILCSDSPPAYSINYFLMFTNLKLMRQLLMSSLTHFVSPNSKHYVSISLLYIYSIFLLMRVPLVYITSWTYIVYMLHLKGECLRDIRLTDYWLFNPIQVVLALVFYIKSKDMTITTRELLF